MALLAVLVGLSLRFFTQSKNIENLYLFSRSPIKQYCNKARHFCVDFQNEEGLAKASEAIKEKLDLIIIAIGLLHKEGKGELKPEKNLKDFQSQNALEVYFINAVVPMLIAQYFLPKLPTDRKSVFCALSARVGSISDNHLGGWYSYRASKAALNQMIRTIAIELERKNKNAI